MIYKFSDTLLGYLQIRPYRN